MTESKQLQDYLEKEGGFHDFIIGSFSFDSQLHTLEMTFLMKTTPYSIVLLGFLLYSDIN
ncbi:Uncharacterised protein [Chlamydia trachomatis]|nr:Uncharacterised protein [Chlamydia trachomatis]